jgi:hypothetical protein
VPHEDQLDPVELARDPAFVGMPQRELAAICRDLAVPYLDLHPILLPHRELGLFVDRLHLSPAGHRRVGAAVVEFLRQHELVRPAPK